MSEENEVQEFEEEVAEDSEDVVADVDSKESIDDESEEVESEQGNSYEDDPELDDEELDRVADITIDVLRGILSHFKASGAEINEYEGDDRELILDIVGGDLGILIGRRGRTLDALQLLVSTMVRKKLGFRYPITVDVESYKHRQRQKLESLAYSAASRAYRQDREVRLRPMTPYERRLVHIALREDKRVETYSVGSDPDRCIVIRPA